MSKSKTKNPTEDLMASLMKELNLSADDASLQTEETTLDLGVESGSSTGSDLLSVPTNDTPSVDLAKVFSAASDSNLENSKIEVAPESLQHKEPEALVLEYVTSDEVTSPAQIPDHLELPPSPLKKLDNISEPSSSDSVQSFSMPPSSPTDKTVALDNQKSSSLLSSNDYSTALTKSNTDSEKTVAIAGYSNRNDSTYEDNVKVSVGQVRGAFSSGYAAWGSPDSQLAQVENLRIAQEKILELEKENEKLRLQNEELIAASEIVKERAELLTSQVQEFKNDRDSLEQSYKNELSLVKNQYNRKDHELQKAQMKIDELDSRLKFDMKKIRIRERELENRLELIRAEKNALVKSKDEQILDLRRKMDQLQLEVESYRQKCVELNKIIDTNQDSFKRTTRALRLAMANLELQEENKVALKKAE